MGVSARLDVVRDNETMFPAVREVETYLRTAVAHSSDGIAREYQERIAEITGYSVRQVRRAIRWLEDNAGLTSVRYSYKTRKPNDYFFTSSDVRTSSTLLVNSDPAGDVAPIEDTAPDAPRSERAKKRERSFTQRIADKMRRVRYVRQWVDSVLDSGEDVARLAYDALSWHVREYGRVMDEMRMRSLGRALGMRA